MSWSTKPNGILTQSPRLARSGDTRKSVCDVVTPTGLGRAVTQTCRNLAGIEFNSNPAAQGSARPATPGVKTESMGDSTSAADRLLRTKAPKGWRSPRPLASTGVSKLFGANA